MPRSKFVERKDPVADPKFNSILVTKFVSRMMIKGKKSTGYRIFCQAMDLIKKKVEDKDPLEVFTKALENVKPMIEVKSRRVGGSTFQVPMEIKENRREALGMRWMIKYSRARSGKSMGQKLSAEVVDAFNNTGSAFKKKEDTHRMAEANKAFAHYRW
jgi:small subunit ribosomal protein S7